MKRLSFSKLKYVLLFSLFFLLTSCSAPQSDDEAFRDFTGQLFCQEVSASTISLHYTLQEPSAYGLTDSPVTYGSFPTDPAAAYISVENYLTALHKFESADLSDENRLTYDILDSYLETISDGAGYLMYQEPLSPLTGTHAQLPVLLSEYPFHNTEDVETYLQLLGKTGEYFDSLITFEQKKSEQGLFMPDYQLQSVIKECLSFVEMGDSNYLYSTFEERLSALTELPESERVCYTERNREQIQETIFPAYTRLAEELKKLEGSGTNEKGLCFFPDGTKYYEYIVRRESGISEPIPTLQQMTRDQISEDLTAMEKILYPTASAPSGSSILETTAPSSMLSDLQNKISGAFPEIPPVNTSIKYVPSAMEEYLSPAFYMIPAIDNPSENVIYINQGQTREGLNLYTTLAHEGYPGHLYQTVYFSSQNADPVRSILDFGGYVEGWATYAEMMSYYMAPLSKAEATLLQKNSSIILGLYALADMGIHYDGWSLTDTVAFFKMYGITDVNAIKNIYELIIGDPGNYLKYYLGYLKFFQLKKEIAGELKSDFSQIEFHRAVLDVGPAPFDIVYCNVRETLLK
ncbi:MAG: DUF885 domain-containing protein [Coprococcus sp.]|nr:DUF885 domain-containing protein [Coprococcus sp.]